MANETAAAAQAGPRMVKVDIVSATVINGAIVSDGTKGVDVSEATARSLLHRGKAILAKGETVDLTGPLTYGTALSDADGDGVADNLQAVEGDTGKGGPPAADGGAGSGKFDPTEPPAGAVSTVSSATMPQPGLSPEEQADAENRKKAAAEAAAKEKEDQAAKAKAEAEKEASAPARAAKPASSAKKSGGTT